MSIAYIIINIIIATLSNNNNIYLFLYSNSIKIKINKNSNVRIFGDIDGFVSENCASEPNEMYINGNNKVEFSSTYDFGEIPEFITLVWNSNNIQSTASMFVKCSAITEIDFSNFDISQVTNMALMFGGCSSLETLVFSKFVTS